MALKLFLDGRMQTKSNWGDQSNESESIASGLEQDHHSTSPLFAVQEIDRIPFLRGGSTHGPSCELPT